MGSWLVLYQKYWVLDGRVNNWEESIEQDEQIFVHPPWFWARTRTSRGKCMTEGCIFAHNLWQSRNVFNNNDWKRLLYAWKSTSILTEDISNSKLVHLKNSHQVVINLSDLYCVKSQDPANCSRFRLSNT
jgi:hypothetical protein